MIPLGNTVAVRVQTSAGEAYSGAVADVDIGKSVVRILVDFNRTHAPDLAIGEKALLFFAEFGQREPSEVLGVAIFRSEDPVRKRYQFQIGRIIGIPRVRRTLGRLAARVRPLPSAPVGCAVQRTDGGVAFRTILYDISATGVGFLVSVTDEPHLWSAWSLRFFLELPQSEEQLEFVINVRHRRAMQAAIRYGADFDPGGTEEFDRKQDGVNAYVAGCQAGWIWAMKDAWRKKTG